MRFSNGITATITRRKKELRPWVFTIIPPDGVKHVHFEKSLFWGLISARRTYIQIRDDNDLNEISSQSEYYSLICVTLGLILGVVIIGALYEAI